MAPSESRRKMSHSCELDLFGPAAQPDLFGEASKKPAVYVPKQIYITNALQEFLDAMEPAEVWPWDWDEVYRKIDRTFEYYLGLVTDPADAQRWRERLAVETARLMASTPPEPLGEPAQDLTEFARPEDNYVYVPYPKRRIWSP